MSNGKPRVVFMGAGAFAVPVLEAISRSEELDLVGVMTQPDREAGRKRILTPTPLGRWADAAGIPCERTASVNVEEVLAKLKMLEPDFIVVVSFGQLLRQPLLDLPKIACVNVHASILPRYRGASPIATAVLNGDQETGVTFMQMEKGLDTGPIYEIHRMPIRPDITTGELEQELAQMASTKIASALVRIASGELRCEAQPESGVSVSAKIKKSDGSVDWNEDAFVLERKVRAYHAWPSMQFSVPLKNRCISVKIIKAKGTSFRPGADKIPGQFLAYTNNQMMICCGAGSLVIERVLPEGKKEMSVADFLNGSHIAVGDVLLNGPERS